MKDDNTTRRGWLQTAAATAGTLTLAQAAEQGPLPKIRFGKHEMTRLVVGANPFYGYMHFNRLFDSHVREWMTEQRVCDVLHECERQGINTWQFHYSERSVSDLLKYREQGGKMQCIILSDGKMRDNPPEIPVAARLGPLGIAHHGGVTDDCYRAGQMDRVRDFLKAIRDSGVMVGLSTHNPEVIQYVEDRGWDIDYYMTCFYRVSRTQDDARKELGEAPLGEVYLERDPHRMCEMVRKTGKTCLGFKILAAGRRTNTPQQVEEAFKFALSNIKPKDAVIVGMYPRYREEVKENASFVRKLGGPPV